MSIFIQPDNFRLGCKDLGSGPSIGFGFGFDYGWRKTLASNLSMSFQMWFGRGKWLIPARRTDIALLWLQTIHEHFHPAWLQLWFWFLLNYGRPKSLEPIDQCHFKMWCGRGNVVIPRWVCNSGSVAWLLGKRRPPKPKPTYILLCSM